VCCNFAADVETVDLTSFDSAVIASTMKKYLRELPNPVIPEQFYAQFIDAASELNVFMMVCSGFAYFKIIFSESFGN